MYTTLITASELQAQQEGGKPLMVFDVSFDLADTAKGELQFAQSHIAGARYAHLDRHLSAKGDADAASGGRHPLPAPQKFWAWLTSIDFTPDMQAVVYDRQGCMFCARLWWMLRASGHSAVAVLDGGFAAWQAAGGAVQAGPSGPARNLADGASFESNRHDPSVYSHQVATDFVANIIGNPGTLILDARAGARYRGEVEPLDRVAGHIPGALNRPFTDNFKADGTFKSAEQLRAEFDALLAGRTPAQVVHHCGSGVTATPNVLAMELAGLSGSQLYAGSWSEWSSDPARPVAQG
jgi:thiosulfate/3-mercaptopyruvate sulfurtransferase